MKVTPTGTPVTTPDIISKESGLPGAGARVHSSGAVEKNSAAEATASNDPLTSDLVSMLNRNEITPGEAVEKLVTRIIEATGAPDSEPLRALMQQQMATDPNLRGLLSQIGVDPDTLIK